MHTSKQCFNYAYMRSTLLPALQRKQLYTEESCSGNMCSCDTVLGGAFHRMCVLGSSSRTLMKTEIRQIRQLLDAPEEVSMSWSTGKYDVLTQVVVHCANVRHKE